MNKAKLEKLYKKIQRQVNTLVEEKAGVGIEQISKEVLLESIEENVYSNKYFEPQEYVRRGTDGGYKDSRNLETYVVKKDGGLSFETENLTMGDDDAYDERIDIIIETGKGYSYPNPPPPRPVFADAKRNIKDRKSEIVDVIKQALKR